MKTRRLEKEKIYTGDLLLVNGDYPLRSSDAGDLVPADPRFADILLRREAAEALGSALERIAACGAIVPVSGYRSRAEQTGIYTDSLKENGEVFTKKYVALPDHSEHQTGLAIDLGLNGEEIDFIRPNFPYEGICEAFRRAAPDYGFILRYPENKEEITRIAHEPWHFRYVGYPHSKIMAENGLSLEEYMEFLRACRADCPLRRALPSGGEVQIYFVRADAGETEISVPRDCVYRISGNNIDGFIVTVWRKNDQESELYGH